MTASAVALTVDALGELKGIRHGFFTRIGGVSEGLYVSLNCGFSAGDDPEMVAVNRDRAMATFDRTADALATVCQVHGARVAAVERPWSHRNRPVADGLVSGVPGVVLGVLTADCAPVLFADGAAGVIGAAHTGWRGAKDGVLEATVRAMVDLGARIDNVTAAIGPCIAQGSYEVGPSYPEPFLKQDPANRGFFRSSRRAGHFLFDFAGYVTRRLAALGLKEIGRLSADTCREEKRFFSYRRATLRGEAYTGRNLSAIVLER